MQSYFLVISFILHVFTILWIFTLFQKINHSVNQTINEEKLKAEIEDLLVAYTAEMKEENEKLLKVINQNVTPKRITKLEPFEQNEIERTTPIHKGLEEKVEEPKVERNEKEYDDYLPPVVEDQQVDMYEQSDTAKVIALAKQGMSADDIAKKLNLGKGEVALMLKFYQS
ncbi:DUF6115 domain-containing protein [Alkalihalobacterium alkalicellulosilyticum]|uniref:DUF6115 domain-containing protein n=1 Tax=Alkalihalobacterium alkalicellulosilyticum TaxID=1912214 RepID=UPI000997BF12|nr:hypothetical protein [Bacillus alkalicellulosilyticus]